MFDFGVFFSVFDMSISFISFHGRFLSHLLRALYSECFLLSPSSFYFYFVCVCAESLSLIVYICFLKRKGLYVSSQSHGGDAMSRGVPSFIMISLFQWRLDMSFTLFLFLFFIFVIYFLFLLFDMGISKEKGGFIKKIFFFLKRDLGPHLTINHCWLIPFNQISDIFSSSIAVSSKHCLILFYGAPFSTCLSHFLTRPLVRGRRLIPLQVRVCNVCAIFHQ